MLYCGKVELAGLVTNVERKVWVTNNPTEALRFAAMAPLPGVRPHRWNKICMN